jgi:hypothetical protein
MSRVESKPPRKSTMNTFVRVLNGPDTGRTIPLRRGQVARFGRTAWADFAFPADAALADVHFELRCEPSGQVVLLNLDESGTLLDGVEVSESTLRPGQRITAGNTVFAVIFDSTSSGLSTATGSNGGRRGTDPSAPRPGESDGQTVSAICNRFELETEEQPTDELSVAEFAAALVAKGRLRDALRFQSFRMRKRHAVWWAWRCLSSQPDLTTSPGTSEALHAAHQWLLDPSDENARVAGDVAEALQYGPAAAWAANAAFWSGNNIGPRGGDAVPPPEHLTGAAVSAAVLLGSVAPDPKATAARQQMFLDLAELVLNGEAGPPPLKQRHSESLRKS